MTHVLETFRRVIAENLRFALTALRAHKLRAFLTMVGIVIGVWTVIGMVALVTGFDRSQTEAFSSFGTTLVQFQKFEPRFGPGRRRRSVLWLVGAGRGGAGGGGGGRGGGGGGRGGGGAGRPGGGAPARF